VTPLLADLNRTFQLPYGSKCSIPLMICRTKATAKLVAQCFIWPGVQKDCCTWECACQPCQRSKVSCHTVTPLGNFTLPVARFLHIHTDLIRPLLTSAGYTYCLTAVDRITCWPELIPILDITAGTVARALLTGWISCFGCPQTITTHQGWQFESQLFQSCQRSVASSSREGEPTIPWLMGSWNASTGH
jgi:hypothetical protein